MKITSGKDIRRNREVGVPITLPSGWVVSVRSIDAGILVKLGRVPDTLSGMVAELMESGATKPDLDSPDAIKAWIEVADAVCELALVNPKIVPTPQADNEICLDDLSMADKFFVLGVLNASAQELERFSEEQARGLELLRAGESDKPIPQSDDASVSVDMEHLPA